MGRDVSGPRRPARAAAKGSRSSNPRGVRGGSPAGTSRGAHGGGAGGPPDRDSVELVRRLALSLPRTHEALVRDRVKFRVGQIVFLAFSRDESTMGFAFPKEEREALVASEPHKFLMPEQSDLRYHWLVVRLSAIDEQELREIVIDAWRMVVPKRVAAEHLGE